MVGRGLQNEILHAFYPSCPKPEACLWFSTVESVYFQIIVTGGGSQWSIVFTLWLFLDFIIHNSNLG
jgi:hypothetical protein